MAAESAFLRLAKARFNQAQEADKNQLQRELDDIKFYNGEQWPDDVKSSRAGQNASNGLPPVPARPCITINKVRQPVRQVLNQERQADMGIEIAPADDFADVEGAPQIDHSEIELREGLVRRIQRESQAQDARTWAFARAVQAGRGYYGVMTRFSKQDMKGQPNPSWWDQEVFVQRFYNQSAVTLDPAHEQPDGSDAEWAFVSTDIPWDQYHALFPKAKDDARNQLNEDMSDSEFRGLGDQEPGWFHTEGPEGKKIRMCRVVDYYYTERESKLLALLPDGSTMWAADVPAGTAILDTRQVIEKKIKWAKIDGVQVLEETDWPGNYIPIIKVVGEELQPHDTERRCEGMVRPARDGNQGFNFMVSKWVEMIGLAPLTPLMVEEGQVEGYEEWYNQANTRTLPYLPYKMSNLDGQKAVSPPFPAPREVPIAPVAASVEMFDQAIKDTTGVPASTLGDTDPSLKSGRAIRQVLDQSRQGTSNYLDNLARSIRHEGIVINDLLYPVYGVRPGRLARIVNGQGEAQTIVIGQPFTFAGEGKFRHPVPAQQGAQGQQVQQYTLTKDASFNLAVKVTKDFDTRREQIVAMLGDMFTANPELMGVYGDIYFNNLDAPGHKQMAERAKAMLVPPVQKLLEGEQQGQASNPADQMKLDQAGQMIEALTQQVQELSKAIETKQIETQGKLQQAQLDGQNRIDVERIKAMTEIEVERIRVEAQRQKELLIAAREAALQDDQQRHEHGEKALDRYHENQKLEQQVELAEEQAENQARRNFAQGEVDQAHAADQGERSHQQQLEAQAAKPEKGASA